MVFYKGDEKGRLRTSSRKGGEGAMGRLNLVKKIRKNKDKAI